MSSIQPNQIELKKIHDRFLNDPVIAHFIKMKAYILEIAMPKYILSNDGLSGPIFDPYINDFLKQIDIDLEDYIECNYHEHRDNTSA
jgi:hypothetical protein